MLDTAQSSVIMWQIFKHVEGGEESENHHRERTRQTEIHSWSFVLMYKKKEKGENKKGSE